MRWIAFRKAIDFQPDNADIRGWFGLELRTLGQYAESVEALERANELGSKRPEWKHDKVAAESTEAENSWSSKRSCLRS